MVIPMVVTNGDDFIKVVPMMKNGEKAELSDIVLTIV